MQTNGTESKIDITGLNNFKYKKLRIFKFDVRTQIKKFYFNYVGDLLVMGKDLQRAFTISFDGSMMKKAKLKSKMTTTKEHNLEQFNAFALVEVL